MKYKRSCHAAVSLAAVAFIASAALAQPTRPSLGEPGSVLVFPLFDSRPASATMINVTNTNQDRNSCEFDDQLEIGTVQAHYVYMGANQADIDDGSAHWQEFNRDELLTPDDTLSVLASRHNPENEIGFLFVAAEDPDSSQLRNFNFLIGSAYIANADLDIMWSYMPYSFQALEKGEPFDNCGWHIIDESEIEFDGFDYQEFPDELYVDSFIEEGGTVNNELVLMSTEGSFLTNEVLFLFANNDETVTSRTQRFICWMAKDLIDISGVAGNLNGDPDEFIRETGWVRIRGNDVIDGAGVRLDEDPPLLGVFMQCVRLDFCAGHALHFSGTQDNAVLSLGA